MDPPQKKTFTKKKGQGAAAAPAAPAATAPPNNNWLEDESPFNELDSLIQKGKIHEIKNFLKQQAKKKDKLDFLAVDPKKGYTIWDAALFKGDGKIKQALREASTTAQVGVMEKREEVYVKSNKAASPKNISEAISAYFEKQKRNAEAAAAAAAAAAAEKKRANDEAAEVERKKWEETMRQAREARERKEKNFETARNRLVQLIETKVSDPTDQRFLELVDAIKNGVDLTTNIIHPFLPPIPPENRYHRYDERFAHHKITLLELLTFLEDPLFLQVIEILRAPGENKYILDRIDEEAKKIHFGSPADKYRMAIKKVLEPSGFYRRIEVMWPEAPEQYWARQPKYAGKKPSALGLKNLFTVTNNSATGKKTSKFNEMFNTNKKELEELLKNVESSPELQKQIVPFIRKVLGYSPNIEGTVNSNNEEGHSGMNGASGPYGYLNYYSREERTEQDIEKIKVLIDAKILPLTTPALLDELTRLLGADGLTELIQDKRRTKEELCALLNKMYPNYAIHLDLIEKGRLDIFDCGSSFIGGVIHKIEYDAMSIPPVLLSKKNINKVGPEGSVLAYFLKYAYQTALQSRWFSEQPKQKYLQLIQQLLNNGANVNQPMPDGSSMLVLCKETAAIDLLVNSKDFDPAFHLPKLVAAASTGDATALYAFYETIIRFQSMGKTPEESLAILKQVPDAQIRKSPELFQLRKALQKEIDAKQPYTGYTQPQLLALNDMLFRPADVSFCPVCLLGITRPTGCLYMEHDCRDTGPYHQELYEKYKDERGKIGWCTVCGRICKSHVHYKLATVSAPRANTSPPVAGRANFYDSTCINQGGGGLLEKFVRLRTFRAKALELQTEVGKKSDYEVRKELIEAVWNSFTDKSGNAQAQALLNRVKVNGKEVFNAIQRRLPLGATPATHNFIPTDEEKARLNALFGNVGMVPTSAFPTGNELSLANRISAAEQDKANAKLEANAVAKSFPWPNAANATKQPVGVDGYCDVCLEDANPVWEFQHGVPMDTHGRICNNDLTKFVKERLNTSYRGESAIRCWSFDCTRTLWPEEIRGKVPDDVYEAYRVFFNKHILTTKDGVAPARGGGGNHQFRIEDIPFIQTESPSLECSLPQTTVSSKHSVKTRKRRNGGGKTRRRRKSRYN
jgi:hypothetical protein